MKSPNSILTQSSELRILILLIGCLIPNSICKYQTPDLLEGSSFSPQHPCLHIPLSFSFSGQNARNAFSLYFYLYIIYFYLYKECFSLYFSYHKQSLSLTHFSSPQIHGEYFLFLLLPTLRTLDNMQ